jgi:hypothetical protein
VRVPGRGRRSVFVEKLILAGEPVTMIRFNALEGITFER